ncbi:helix-turn-helix transcriptional regulator [Pseudofrankia sp. BMG5.36]|uniref:helix-turn-helix domain-containing protein n=1 Tax=Pseudofrankia sp. BMG5.36 TaxID=1834512 RepID=UPI0018E35918|nr:helix-turn-helix transcriptional regulator [Pseudofrankia sp. BMG5.36]
METFGEALRRWRGELPIRELARRAHCGKSHIWALESGRSSPSLRIAAALDKTLNAGGELVELAGRPPATDATGISTSVAGPALATGPVTARSVDPAVTDYFETQLEGHYRADMLLGPRDLIRIVATQFELIDRLARATTADTHRDLLRIGTAYAALVGWLYQDAGDLAASAFWRGIAQEFALRSGDSHLTAYALINHASVRTDLGDGAGVLDLCDAALATSDALAPKVRLMTLQQRAHGASLLGDRATVDTSLDTADTLTDRLDDDLPWGNACHRTPGYLQIQRATCYGRLGLAHEAVALWDHLLTDIPPTARRDHGVYLTRHATACAQAGQPDKALHLARQVVPIATETGSARLRRELAALRHGMRPWKDARVATDLAEVLAATEA